MDMYKVGYTFYVKCLQNDDLIENRICEVNGSKFKIEFSANNRKWAKYQRKEMDVEIESVEELINEANSVNSNLEYVEISKEEYVELKEWKSIQ